MSALPTRANIAGTPDNATAKAALAAIFDFMAQRLAAGTSGAGTATAAELLAARESLQLAPAAMSNLWMNSDFAINQRVATTAADGAYGFDRTYILTESGSLTLSQLAQPTDGIPYAMRMTQPDASAKRMGFAQAVEARNCLAYRASNLVFVPKLRSSATGTLRVALLAHTGGADSITKDVINNWSSTTYTPGNFFIASDLSVIAVGSTAVTANTWTDVPVSSTSAGGVVAPSTMNNLIMVAWTEAQQAQNATLDVSCVRAGLGSQTPIWTPPDAQQELARCQRYLPAVRCTGAGNHQWMGSGQATSTTSVAGFVPFRVPARIAPTGLTVSDATKFAVLTSTGTATATTAVAYANASVAGAMLNATVTGVTAGNASAFGFGAIGTSSDYIIFTGAEL